MVVSHQLNTSRIAGLDQSQCYEVIRNQYPKLILFESQYQKGVYCKRFVIEKILKIGLDKQTKALDIILSRKLQRVDALMFYSGGNSCVRR